jgi:oligopeptide/dipeptide ABC transporter ATP-binding protein
MNDDRDRQVLLKVQSLRTHFHTIEGVVRAVVDVDFTLRDGETLGVVGESGCGKSVTALSIMNLLPRRMGRIEGGRIVFRRSDDGGEVDLASLPPDGRAMRSIRGNEIAMIFQEPMTSLNPVRTIGWQICESLMNHHRMSKAEALELAVAQLARVGIAAPRQRVDQHPFELSGGMRQRAMIAMALACGPRLLIADEPTTALDVTVQAQILRLMRSLQEESGMSLMIITHDLGVIGEMAKRVIVMYMGRIVEMADIDQLFYDTKHPYTLALLRSLPVVGYKRRLEPIGGSVPSPYDLPPHCRFEPRCPRAMPVCRERDPELVDLGDGHRVRCLLYEEGKR